MPRRYPRLPHTGSKLSDKVRKIVHSMGQLPEIDWIRTGIHALDLMMGDGIPLGRTIEIFGDESVGKSLLAWEIAKAFQREGGVVVLFDTEATAPKRFMERVGVNVGEIIHRKPDTIEELEQEFFDIHTAFTKADPKLKVLYLHDTIAATSSEGEWEWSKKKQIWVPKETEMGARARAMSRMLRHITKEIDKTQSVYIGLNQVRDKIGVMFGEKTTTPGGRAMRFHASIRIQLNRGQKMMGADQRYTGVQCHAFTKKNKVAEPFRKAPLCITWKKGFEEYAGLAELLESQGRLTLVHGKPGWYQYKKLRFRVRQLPMIVEKRPELIDALF